MPKKVSLKHIVAAIDKALEELGTTDKSLAAGVGDDRETARARKALKGLRETVEGICLPDFEVPA